MSELKWYSCQACAVRAAEGNPDKCYAATLEENILATTGCFLADDEYNPGPAEWKEIDSSEVPI